MTEKSFNLFQSCRDSRIVQVIRLWLMRTGSCLMSKSVAYHRTRKSTNDVSHRNGSSSTPGHTPTRRIPDRYFKLRYWKGALKRTGTILLCIYIAIPFWFYACPWLRRQCIFLHNFNWPPFAPTNLSDPEIWDQFNTKHLFVNSEEDVRLGVWHIFPSSQKKHFTQLNVEDYFADNRPVIIYCHGNSMNRAALYRLHLYRMLRDVPVDAHIITFDYRGFGDSTYQSPSVRVLVKDAETIYKWVQKWVPRSRIFVWGHSLGSGVSVQLADKLSQSNSPAAIILESPFTNIPDATKTFPLSAAHRVLPFFDKLISEPTRHDDTNFNSDQKIGNMKCPMLILHATDDDMVGVELGRKLHSIAVAEQATAFPRAIFVEFDAKLRLGHLWLSHNPELPGIVAKFIGEHCDSCGREST